MELRDFKGNGGRRLTMLLAAFIAAVWFAGPHLRTLTEPDEGRYAEIPREMLSTGDWITPHLDGIPYLEKPPLQYWATAIAYRALGESAWVSRLWTAGLGFLGLGTVYFLAKRLFGVLAARFASLILASCPLYVVLAQISVLDMGLAFFLSCALGCFLLAQRQPADSHLSRRWMWGCALALGLAFLQKGLVAFLIPGLTLICYSLIQRDWRIWARLHLLSVLAIVTAIALPWIVLVSSRNPDFLNFFFIHEHLLRFASTVHDRVQPWWFFAIVLAVGAMPWLPAMARGILNGWRAKTNAGTLHAERFLIIWACVLLLFFSASESKLVPYVVPIMAPLSLLAGKDLAREMNWRLFSANVVFSVLLGIGLFLGSFAVELTMDPGLTKSTYLAFGTFAQIAGAIILCTPIMLFVIRPFRHVPIEIAASIHSTALCLAFVVLSVGTNSLEPVLGGPSASASIRAALKDQAPLYCVGTYPQTITFTLKKTCTLVAYRGEIIRDSDTLNPHWIPTIHEFAAQWSQHPDGVALVDPKIWPALQDSSLSMETIAITPTLRILRHPTSRSYASLLPRS